MVLVCLILGSVFISSLIQLIEYMKGMSTIVVLISTLQTIVRAFPSKDGLSPFESNILTIAGTA